MLIKTAWTHLSATGVSPSGLYTRTPARPCPPCPSPRRTSLQIPSNDLEPEKSVSEL